MEFGLLSFLAISLCSAPQALGGDSELWMSRSGQAYDHFGQQLQYLPDINGDGYSEFIAYNTGGYTGVSVCSSFDGSLLRLWTKHQQELFGWSIASPGDLNGDGIADVLISSPGSDQLGVTDSGLVQLMDPVSGAEINRWVVGDEYEDGRHSAVYALGDVDQDGTPDFAIAAPQEESKGNVNNGRVQVISGATGLTYLEWFGEPGWSGFARGVGAPGDINGDGYADISFSFNIQGQITQHIRSGADGSLLQLLTPSNFPGLCCMVATGVGDIDFDGYDDYATGVSAGVSSDYYVAINSGVDGSRIHKLVPFKPTVPRPGCVKAISDQNNDGYPDIMVSEIYTNHHRGSVNFYSGKDGDPFFQLEGPNGDIHDHFGFWACVADDLNSDGSQDFLVSISQSSAVFPSAGEVHAYTYAPLVQIDSSEISASAGGSIQISLDFSVSHAFDQYQVLFSTGMGPTLTRDSVWIPVLADRLAIDSFMGAYPFPGHTGLQGLLDANGQATASIWFHPGDLIPLIGRKFHLAVTAAPVGMRPQISSIRLPITIEP